MRPVEDLCVPECEICGGSGYIALDEPDIHKPQFGRLEFCPNVDKWGLPGAIRYGLEKSEIESMDWDGLMDPEAAEGLIKAVERLIERGHGWLYVWGPYGLGKTYALKTAVAILLRSGKEASYVRMAQIMDRLRSGFENPEVADSNMNWWTGVPFLAIDEFDRMRSTEYASEQQFVLMDQRYESAVREQTATIIASNHKPEDLETPGSGYLVDRIRDRRFEVLEMIGDSMRQVIR